MGRILLAVILAGCTHAATTSPAWPKQHEAEKDGGESLAPHESKQRSVAVEKTDDDVKPEPKVETKPVEAKPAEAATGLTSPAVTQPTEETITTEDIIIEIDD